MEKVLLSNQEAEALKSALEINGGDKAHVISWHSQDLWSDKLAVLNDLDLNTVCTALYVGYEVEPGPEEKVMDYYQSLDTSREFSADWHKSIAVSHTLKLLNIHIKGNNC
ncbi:hypothetical protein [Neobacillus sp. 114]|uniref:hypothetical protein n=1 Tax=Neobacillus sp. 114 TaxID=3048535 RepID=UPI0024C376D2|nr:hypothetical protein [Neobacillus sp. 114]